MARSTRDLCLAFLLGLAIALTSAASQGSLF